MASSTKTLLPIALKHLRNQAQINISRNVRTASIPSAEPKNLSQRLSECNIKDPDVDSLVDIGFRPEHHEVKKKRQVHKNPALFEAFNNKTLKVDLGEVKEEWKKSTMGAAVRSAARHYGVFNDLFHHGIFTPRVMIDISYDYDDETVSPVHRGNIILPSEATKAPEVVFESKPDDLWTLILTNPDGHLSEENSEYIHWFIGNIKGSNLKSGDEIFPYLQPIPVKGTGYQRMVFILYKQGQAMDYSSIKRPNHPYNLKSRTFETLKFYQTHQDFITPAGLAFYQTIWDNSLMEFFHRKLEIPMPVYKYIHEPEYIAPQVKYPERLAFDRYLDKYRDIKDIRKEVLLKRLKTLNPFEEEPPMSKYPNIYKNPPKMFSWQKANLWKERNRIGKFRDLRPHSAFEQPEFDFKKMYDTPVGIEPVKKK